MTVASNNRLKSLANLLSLGGVALIALGLAYQYLTPKMYQASARVRVEMRGLSQAADSATHPAGVSEAAAMLDEYKYLRSDAFLAQVIQNLGLREIWGRRSPPAASLSTNDALVRLRMQAQVRIIPNTSLIEILVTSEDPAEIAPIANEIARLYRDYRRSQSQAVSREKIKQLQDKWEEQNQKVIAAQQALAKLAFEINMARATNATRFYDSDSYEALETKRIDLESQYVQQQKLQADLKAMGPEQLRQVLPSLVTNERLNDLSDQQFQAERALTQARLDHAPESPEVRHASATVDLLNQKVADAVAGIMVSREADLASLKTMIVTVNDQLKNASTNAAATAAEPPTYVEARKKLDDVTTQRDQLKTEIDNESLGAAFPLTLSAEIVDTAETPAKPASPDERLVRYTIGAGASAGVLGLLLLLAGQMRKPPPPPRR